MDEIELKEEDISKTEENYNNHKALKVWTIILFVLSCLAFAISCYYFVNFVLTDEIGKAILIVIMIFIPVICLVVTLISLIVCIKGRNKLKLSKVLMIMNIIFVVLELSAIIFYLF